MMKESPIYNGNKEGKVLMNQQEPCNTGKKTLQKPPKDPEVQDQVERYPLFLNEDSYHDVMSIILELGWGA